MNTAPTRPQPLQEKTMQDMTRIKTRGHLALLEWEELPTPAVLPWAEAATRRTFLDRCYTGGILFLFVTTIAALAVSLCR